MGTIFVFEVGAQHEKEAPRRQIGALGRYGGRLQVDAVVDTGIGHAGSPIDRRLKTTVTGVILDIGAQVGDAVGVGEAEFGRLLIALPFGIAANVGRIGVGDEIQLHDDKTRGDGAQTQQIIGVEDLQGPKDQIERLARSDG